MTMTATEPTTVPTDTQKAFELLVLLVLIDHAPTLASAYALTIGDHTDLVKHVRTWGLPAAALPRDPETRHLVEETSQWLFTHQW